MSENQQEEQSVNPNNFSFTETEVIPFKSFKDFQFDNFNIKDIVNEQTIPRLRISYYFQDNGNTYYNFLELNELQSVLSAFEYLLERAVDKEVDFKEYNARTQYGFSFGSYWIKKEGWNFFVQINQESPRIYPKEKEFRELFKTFNNFYNSVCQDYESND